MAFVLFSAMRNEGPFILDWIAYHRAVGFDRICIVTNDCTDGSDDLLEELSADGSVLFVAQDLPEDLSPQRAAVALTEEMGVVKDGDWAIFLDADEYLNIHIGQGRVEDLVSYLDEQDKAGMLINWRLFGDSGQSRFTGSYISPDFTRCEAPSEKTTFKTFFRKGPIAKGFSGDLHRCRLAPGVGKNDDFLTGSGLSLGHGDTIKANRRHRFWLSNGEEPYSTLTMSERGYDIAQINHYAVRDPQSFAIKQKRGRGHISRANSAQARVRHSRRFYRLHNRNEQEETTILRWSDAVVREKDRLLGLGQTATIYRRILMNYLGGEEQGGRQMPDIHQKDHKPDFPLTFPMDVQAFVRERYAEADNIIEYGSGGSTVLAAELGKRCLSVESDKAWAEALNSHLTSVFGEERNVHAYHVDVGETQEWGYPRDTASWARFWRYPMQVWQQADDFLPDIVLIDGRMRMACLAATMMHVRRETVVLFDDYRNRRKYHRVEALIKPERMIGRMAVFKIKPGMIDADAMPRIIPWFFDLT